MRTKLQLFSDFSKSLEAVTGLRDSYECPLCLRTISRGSLAELEREHYVPESLGGNKLVLVCQACNRRLAETVDPQLKRYAKRKEIEDMYPESRPMIYRQVGRAVRVAVKGLTGNEAKRPVRAAYRITLTGRDDIPQKKAIESWTGFLDETVKNGTWAGTQFQLQDDKALQHNMRLVEIGLLRTGYLAAFAGLGYGYILWPTLDKVRDQILNPQKELLTHFVIFRRKQTTNRRIVYHYLKEPVGLLSLLVQFQGFDFPQEWAVFLPLPFDKDLKIYENTRMLVGNRKELSALIFEPNMTTRHARSLMLVDDEGKQYPIY